MDSHFSESHFVFLVAGFVFDKTLIHCFSATSVLYMMKYLQILCIINYVCTEHNYLQTFIYKHLKITLPAFLDH